MKKTVAHLLSTIILVAFLFTEPGLAYPAQAAGAEPQGGVGTFSLVTGIPTTLCKDETVLVTVVVQGNATTDSQFVIVSDNSITPQKSWTIPKGTQHRPPVIAFLKATKIGAGFINFGFIDGPAGQTQNFEVVECDYSIDIKAVDTTKADKISFLTTTSGSGGFSSAEVVAGHGNYTLTFSPDLKQSPDSPCALTGEASGPSQFEISGSNKNGTLTINIDFAKVVIGIAPEFVCDDRNDNHGITALFEGVTLDPDTSLHLSGVVFPPGGSTREFPFGTTGNCTVTILKREKK